MLDLLADLRTVAEKKAMFELAEHLDDALVVAAREIRAHAVSDVDADGGDAMGERLSGPAFEHDVT